MVALNTSDARDGFDDLIRRVRRDKERIVLEGNGHPEAALIPIEDLALLEALEDRSDVEEAEKRLDEPGELIAWEDIKKNYGL